MCIEHGYALKSLNWRRVVAVMNTAMGHPDQYELPFDVRHTCRPILFNCPEDASPEARRTAKDALTKQLVAALKAIFADEVARIAMSAQPESDSRQTTAEAALRELASDLYRGGVPEIVTQPRLILRLAPFAAAEGRRLDPSQVAEMQLRFPPSVNERVQSEVDGRQWWSCAPPRRRQANLNPETTWLMRLVRPGYLEFQTNIGERIDDDPQILVDGRHLEATIVRTLERMAVIALGLNMSGRALVSTALGGVGDVELTRARPGGRSIRRPEIVLPTVILADLSKPLATSLHEQFDILWHTFGWTDGSPSFGGGDWAGYADKRNYDYI